MCERNKHEAAMDDEFGIVIEYEKLFRGILEDVKERFPGIVPASIDPQADLNILKKYFNSPSFGSDFGIGGFWIGPQIKEDPKNFLLYGNTLEEGQAAIEIHHNRSRSSLESRTVIYNTKPQFKRETRNF